MRPTIEQDGVKIGNTKHLFVEPIFAVLKKVNKLGFNVAGKSPEEIEKMFEGLLDDDGFVKKWNDYIKTIFGKEISELSLDALKPSEVGRIIGNFTASDSPLPNPSTGTKPSPGT